MKVFVIMLKSTGDLFEARRFAYLDIDASVYRLKKANYFVSIMKQDGWAFFHPQVVPFYMHEIPEELYENLGEL